MWQVAAFILCLLVYGIMEEGSRTPYVPPVEYYQPQHSAYIMVRNHCILSMQGKHQGERYAIGVAAKYCEPEYHFDIEYHGEDNGQVQSNGDTQPRVHQGYEEDSER